MSHYLGGISFTTQKYSETKPSISFECNKYTPNEAIDTHLQVFFSCSSLEVVSPGRQIKKRKS